jgi:hypothetical protein
LGIGGWIGSANIWIHLVFGYFGASAFIGSATSLKVATMIAAFASARLLKMVP